MPDVTLAGIPIADVLRVLQITELLRGATLTRTRLLNSDVVETLGCKLDTDWSPRDRIASYE